MPIEDNKRMINWLKNQPTSFLEKVLKKAKLPEKLEQVFICRCIKQLSCKETNELLHITDKQQKLKITKIREKIKDLIQDQISSQKEP